MVEKKIRLSAHTVLRNWEMRASSSSPVARQKLRGGWHDQLVHAAQCHWSSTGALAKPMRAHTRAHTHTYALTHTHIEAPTHTDGTALQERLVCVSDLPDMSGNLRSMIYMGITSTDQTSIKSTEGTRTADRSIPDDLFASPGISTRHKPIPPLFFSFFSLFSFLWLSILGVQEHTNEHTHAQSLLYNYLPYYTTSTQRGSLNLKWSIRVLRNCVIHTGETPYLYSPWHTVKQWSSPLKLESIESLPPPLGRRLEVTLSAALATSGA